MSDVKAYLKQNYEITKRPFFTLKETVNVCGKDTRLQLTDLKKMIKARRGFNGPLIEILDFETKWK
jgi:hypothetical protein